MINYIGDISKADAEVLMILSQTSENILEFGCGASTQVIANYKPDTPGGIFISIDTSPEWIERTRKNLEILKISTDVQFSEYHSFMKLNLDRQYDFIFVDGVDALRREFALKIWNRLSLRGVMAFHDTRRAPDFRNFIEVVASHFTEICDIQLNYKHSNISFLSKKENEPYDNWQITENKQPWQLGYDTPPIDKKGNIIW